MRGCAGTAGGGKGKVNMQFMLGRQGSQGEVCVCVCGGGTSEREEGERYMVVITDHRGAQLP